MEILEVFRRDYPFGAFLDVQLVPPPAMLWQLMVREANVEGAKGSEMWFVVNGVAIRYSLMEFSLITGLKCSQLAPGYEEQYDKDSLPVFVKENWSKGVVCYTSVVERFSKLCQLLDDEGKKEYALQWIVKVATLMFVVLVLTGHAKKDAPVPKWILAIVANSDDSMSFPWGTWAFLESLRIQSLGKDLVSEKKKLVKGRKTSNTLRYTGFCPPLIRRNSSKDEVHSSSEGSEIPSKKYVLRRRKVSKPCTPHEKAEHRPMLETQSPLLERITNIKASSLSGNSSQILPNSLKDYIDGKFSELQKTLCLEVENFLERKFETLEESILLTLLASSKGGTDEAKEYDGKKEEPVEVNEADHSIHEGVDNNEEDEIKDGKEDEKVDPPCFEWLDHNEDAIKDGKEEEPVGVNKVDPYSFDGVDHNEEGKKDGKEEDGKEEVGKEGDGKEEDEPIADNMVKLSSFEGIPEEKDEEEVDQFKVKNRFPPIQEEEEEKFADEGEANEDEMAMSDKIVHDVVEFCKSTENNVDEKVESDGDVLRELTDVDGVAAARELGRGLQEKKRSIHISSPYFSNVLKKVKVINSNVSNELDKAEEEQLNKRRNPSSQQLEAFHQFMQSAIGDGREVQCIMEKRRESHGIVKKWWSSLMESGGWLETTHMEEIMIYFMKMYNKKDSTYVVLPESFQMLGEVNATTELFPILDTGLAEIVLGRWDSCSKPWKDISCVYWVHNIKDHWVAIRAEFDRKCLVVFDSLQRITSMSKLEEELSKMLTIFPVMCQYASNYLQGIPGDHRDMTAKWSVERPLVPQQTNSDCGVFALKFIELGVQNLQPSVLSGEDDDDIESSFVHKLEAHNVIPKESYLELPRSFCANNGISDGTMKIKIYGPAMYPNEVTLSVKESGCRLTKGWHNFVEDNGLRLGDKVVLTFIAENTIIVYASRHRMLPRLTNY
ncbi:unnamed protein product [Cuscuta campestris]|uniref:TF-B3 domain-containing protein n=1 Tax=Cuscuta campestris TaxID=132261 RepID=A0A484KYF1_9ASTE|nr:unnamed protein product [Cuscuta campestris]